MAVAVGDDKKGGDTSEGEQRDPFIFHDSSPGYGRQENQSGHDPRGFQAGSAVTYQAIYSSTEVVSRGAGSNVTATIIGSDSGRTAATIVGAAGGAVAGNVIEGRRRADHETFRVSVRLDNGSMQTITQENINDLRTGDRVRLDGNLISRV